jgi:hypothetical protein
MTSMEGTVKRKVYWSNLFRIRYWAFVIGGSFVIGLLVTFVMPTIGSIVTLILLPLLAYFWLGVQMACPHCGRILAANSIAGQPDTCSHCGKPVD